MRFARPASFAVLALLALSGCRTGGVDNLARRDPPPSRPSLDARTVITEHNRNAERIESLEAAPSLMVTSGRKSFGVNGRLALERPHNFKLDISHTSGEVADIGSNDEKFWFWVRENKDKAVYYCNYDEAGHSPLAATLQPDWIVEALGLRVIPETEAGDFKVTRGESPGSLVLTHLPTKTGGETVTRVTIISEATHRIREHRLYSGDQKTLLARAVVDDYMKVVPEDRPEEVVYVPKQLKLEWLREKLTMEVTFNPSTTAVNKEFPQTRRDALFVEQAHEGYAPRNLAGNLPRTPRGPTDFRETLPAPPAGVRLGEPAPVGVDDAMRTERDPVALSADLPSMPSLNEALVGPAIPKAPELLFARPSTSTRWRSATSASFEN